MGQITLSGKGRRWLLSGHPWVYADDIATGEGEPGELVPVLDPAGASMGWGLFSNTSRIAVRLVTRAEEQPNRAFWAERMRRAVALRRKHGLLENDGACRLLSGDAEGVPGLLVDWYAGVLVLQCGTQASDRMRPFLLELLIEALGEEPVAIVDRSDTSVRKLEGLEKRVEIVQGNIDGTVEVREGDIRFRVNVLEGHKTGAYLDQRDNRIATAKLATGRRMLDSFSYDGLFAIHALKAGAEHVVCLEQNKAACERIQANAELNGVADRIEIVKTNCMNELRVRAERDETYGVIVVDPPAFARSKKEVRGAERGYVELNRRAFLLAESQGHVVSASCSYNIRPEEFVSFLSSAGRLTGKDVWLTETRGAGLDHPHLITLPETQYLKCAFMRIG